MAECCYFNLAFRQSMLYFNATSNCFMHVTISLAWKLNEVWVILNTFISILITESHFPRTHTDTEAGSGCLQIACPAIALKIKKEAVTFYNRQVISVSRLIVFHQIISCIYQVHIFISTSSPHRKTVLG